MTARSIACRIAFAAALFLPAACTDTASSDDWQFDGPDAGEWQSLDGPPGSHPLYLGPGDSTHYFWVGREANGGVVYATYNAQTGWGEARALGNLLARKDLPAHNGGLTEPSLVRAGDHRYLGHHGTTRPDVLLHTDGKQAWHRVTNAPDIASINGHGRHRGAYYLYGGPESGDSPGSLWRSPDGSQTWERVRDDIVPNRVAIRPDRLVVRSHHRLKVSTDGGENWKTYSNSCEGFHWSSRWFRHQGQPYFVDPPIRRFAPAADCPTVELDGLGDKQKLADVDSLEEGLLGVTTGGEFGHITPSLDRWNPVSLPAGADVQMGPSAFSFVALDGNAVGVPTSHGLLRTTDGEHWTLLPDSFSRPEHLLEHDGKLLVETEEGTFQHTAKGNWQLFSVELAKNSRERIYHGRLLTRAGRLFLSTTHPSEVLVEITDGEPSGLIQKGDLGPSYIQTSEQEARPVGPLDIEFHYERVFVSSRQLDDPADAPPADLVDDKHKPDIGASVHVADAFDGNFQPFTDDLWYPDEGPPNRPSNPTTVRSMVGHGEFLWVATQHAGIWRAPLDSGKWQWAHDGLPTANDESRPVRRLVSLGDRLFALARDAIYVRGSSDWRQFTSDPLSESWSFENPRHGIRDLVRYQGRLIVATHEGLYLLDPETGEHELFWQHDRFDLLTGRATSSGLYIGLNGAGVWRFGPPQ